MDSNDYHILGDDYYYARNGKEQDSNLAFRHWLEGAKMGSVQCMENVAWAYRDGIGVIPNFIMQQKWAAKYAYVTTYHSDPQIQQDRWVKSVLEGKRNGYFVEVGASTGVQSSNCCTLERKLGWTGICIEPNPDFFKELVKNRAVCVQCPIAPDEREVQFRTAGYYGGIQENLSEWHKKDWEGAPLITMQTRRLEDILDEYNAPPVIDYLSLDIEGGEAAIIESFQFDRYKVLTMTVEKSEDRLNEVIESKGFKIVRNQFSDPSVDWELHCIHESIL